MGQGRKRSPRKKEKGKGLGKGKGKGTRSNTECDVRIQTDDLTLHSQPLASHSNDRASTESTENSGSSFFENISESTITGGTFNQTNGHSNSVTIKFVNNYPHVHDSSTTQPPQPLQPSLSQNIPTGPSSSPVDTRPCTSSPTNLPQQKTNYDIYREQLELQRRGIPLWIPESNGSSSKIYQRTGATIGDVGIVTPFGAFSYVFNICLPRDHPSQPKNLPEDFKPISSTPMDIQKFMEFKSGSHLASKTIHKISNDGRSTDFIFETDASEAAILTLPEGSVAHDLENIPQIQAYAASNIESWYRYINGTRGRQAKNGEIRLVIGCDKTTSWGMAVIDSQERPTHHQLRFRSVESGTPSNLSSSPIPLYTWDYSGYVDAKVGPYPEEIKILREGDDLTATTTGKYSNQCLFIRTLDLTLRDDVFESINDEIALALTEGRSSFTSTSYNSTNSSSSSINEPRSGDANQAACGTNFGTQRRFSVGIGDERVTITTSPTAEKSHPSDMLHKKMLEKAPRCRIAITRDEHWCSIINEDDESMPSTAQIAERVLNSYDIVEENGVAFLEHKKNALSKSTSSQPLSLDIYRSEPLILDHMNFHGNLPDPTFLDDEIFAASLLYGLPEDMPPVSLTADAQATLYRNGTPSIRSVQCTSPVAEPFEFPVEYSSGHNLDALSLVSESTTQWTGIHWNSQAGSAGEGHVQLQSQGGGTNPIPTSANTSYGPNPWTQLQRTFLKFLVRNCHILQSLSDSTPSSIDQVKHAFEQNNLTFNHSADLDRIIQQFKPQVSTAAIGRECDLKKKDATSTGKFVCPFRFCDGYFTRGTGLQNHLAAHFKLKPCRCSRCGKYYSDTAFDRHVDGCKA